MFGELPQAKRLVHPKWGCTYSEEASRPHAIEMSSVCSSVYFNYPLLDKLVNASECFSEFRESF